MTFKMVELPYEKMLLSLIYPLKHLIFTMVSIIKPMLTT